MSDVIDFVCLRIQSELDKYIKTKTVPHDLLEGTYSIDDIKKCKSTFTKRQQKAADRLINQYTKNIQNNLESLKTALRKDYENTIGTLRSTHPDFMFPSVLVKYRNNINPITALYYELREALRTYNSENEYKVWIVDLVSDMEFNNKLIGGLSTDIKRLERIIQRYYWPLVQIDNNIPLELFHARQLIKDYKHYITVFESIKHFDLDE
jgi:hypothetical protein